MLPCVIWLIGSQAYGPYEPVASSTADIASFLQASINILASNKEEKIILSKRKLRLSPINSVQLSSHLDGYLPNLPTYLSISRCSISVYIYIYIYQPAALPSYLS